MADKRCFVQFPHPGGEHKPDGGRKIGWNKTYRNKKPNPHKRKFMQFRGKWIDENDKPQTGNLRAWGEWEPESELISKFDLEDGGAPHPNYLWEPYWVPRETYQCLHNTDPFIFGDCFLYSNCHKKNQSGLRTLDQGSVLAFGSKVKHEWVLDTVFVVRDSFPFDPLDPSTALGGKVPEAFLEITGGPLTSDPNLKLADDGTAQEFRLYRGATPDNRVDDMFSFFPAVPADRETCFRRPIISLDEEYFNPRNFRTPKGTRHCRDAQELRRLWDLLVAQVRGTTLSSAPALRCRNVERDRHHQYSRWDVLAAPTIQNISVTYTITSHSWRSVLASLRIIEDFPSEEVAGVRYARRGRFLPAGGHAGKLYGMADG